MSAQRDNGRSGAPTPPPGWDRAAGGTQSAWGAQGPASAQAGTGANGPSEDAGWKPGATWKGQPPTPPDQLRKQQRRRRMGRSRGVGGVARFFTKQALWFVVLAFALAVVDVVLYTLVATHEMDRNYQYGTPATVTRQASEQLAQGADGAWVLGAEAAALLDEQGAWAQLVDEEGQVIWSRNVPQAAEAGTTDDSAAGNDTPANGDAAGSTAADGTASGTAAQGGEAAGEANPEGGASEPSTVTARDPSDAAWGTVPSSYRLFDIALLSHYRSVNGFPVFIWERDDGLLLVGFPPGSYETVALTWPQETWQAIPGYVFGVLALDLLILFAAYLVYRRRTQRAVEPIADALDVLSRGGRVELDLKGDLQPIADHINETSDVLERKDSARELWIRGVSHDIRTPLSLIIAKADGIAAQEGLPDAARADARAIRTQGFKIKDLVADLNAASQLAFDERPLDLQRVHLPRLLRAVAASYLNSGLDATHPLEFELADAAADACVLGDERLLARLVENLLANARLHNEQGCHIRLSLEGASNGAGAPGEAGRALLHPAAVLRVADDGIGMGAADMAKLQMRLGQARLSPEGAVPDDAGHGLGLVLVDRIARAHGGELSVSSEKGRGFTAAVTLPLA